MDTIHKNSWRYARIPSAENSSALWTHGKQRLHFLSSGVFHAASSLPMSSSSLKTPKFSGISNTKISVGAAFKGENDVRWLSIHTASSITIPSLAAITGLPSLVRFIFSLYSLCAAGRSAEKPANLLGVGLLSKKCFSLSASSLYF
ncbi:hypothetical protein Y032_0020g189 [Ancylostoma ceylanicum]|uniref:Uncharacterized protein n=1 Tax=Ancylostoma ceylanicum TaxID=53326 RepID=A0A016V1C9_9BILA|nr:hypothetical protein Y032_0020g189 [Ancylostoma ceylanicum]